MSPLAFESSHASGGLQEAELRRVRDWLSKYGAPLSHSGTPHAGPLPALDEILLDALRYSHLDATLARALPVFLWRNSSKFNLPSVARKAREAGQGCTLGFFLELTTELTNDDSFSSATAPLRSLRPSQPSYFFQSGDSELERLVARRNTPEAARRWGFLMNMPVDSFRSLFLKFRR
jgi:hypothetical protein